MSLLLCQGTTVSEGVWPPLRQCLLLAWNETVLWAQANGRMHRQEGGERLLVNVKGMGECQWGFALTCLFGFFLFWWTCRIALRRADLSLCQTAEAQWIWLPPKRPFLPSESPAEEAPRGQSLPTIILQSCQDASAAQLLAWFSNPCLPWRGPSHVYSFPSSPPQRLHCH